MYIVKGKLNILCLRYDGGFLIILVLGNLFLCNGVENFIVRFFGVKYKFEDFWKEEWFWVCYNFKMDCSKCCDECIVCVWENLICNFIKSSVNVVLK